MIRLPFWPERSLLGSFRIGKLTVRAPFLVCLFWFAVLYFDSSGFVLIGLMASLWHETGHVLCYRLLFCQWPLLTISLGGISLDTVQTAGTAYKILYLAAAGPLANGAAAGVWYWVLQRRFTVRCAAHLAAHLLIGGFNLLPVPPLDGFRVLNALLEIFRQKLHFARK